jgi:hypothetical protein
MRDIQLPEFNKNCRISQQKAIIFDHNDCKYDIILGTNFLSEVDKKLNYVHRIMESYDITLPPHPHKGIHSNKFNAMEDMYHIKLEDEPFGVDWLQCFATHILDAKYEFTDVKNVIDQQTHLSTQQQADY